MNILITGSTDGIGKLAALKIAKEGHQLFIHGRSPQKVDSVIDELKRQSGNEAIEGFLADFSNLSEVLKMSDQINEKLTSLDVLINNAGVYKSSQPITQDGYDIRMVVNYFAPFLLTNRIINLLRSSSEARIINLSSAAQDTVSLDLLDGKMQVSDHEAYAQSKLALLMWSYYLAQQEPEIAVIALNPGSLLNTNMVKEAFGKFWSSADKGAEIIYDLALSKDYKDITGKYFDNDRGNFGPAHPDANNSQLVNTLIDRTHKVLNSVNKK